jgi:hyperosmotically inducible periplasmic protein
MRKRLLVCLVLATLSTALTLSAQIGRVVPAPTVQHIEKEVRHQILLLPWLNLFDNITYKVDGYQVTLMGQVTREYLKKDAENAVKQIEGVEKVVNQIEVLPASSMDDQLRTSLYRAIYEDQTLERYAMPVVKPIRIIVKNGHVTLEGVVNSEFDKNLVNIRANGVSGIFSVTNNLRVAKQ